MSQVPPASRMDDDIVERLQKYIAEHRAENAALVAQLAHADWLSELFEDYMNDPDINKQPALARANETYPKAREE